MRRKQLYNHFAHLKKKTNTCIFRSHADEWVWSTLKLPQTHGSVRTSWRESLDFHSLWSSNPFRFRTECGSTGQSSLSNPSPSPPLRSQLEDFGLLDTGNSLLKCTARAAPLRWAAPSHFPLPGHNVPWAGKVRPYWFSLKSEAKEVWGDKHLLSQVSLPVCQTWPTLCGSDSGCRRSLQVSGFGNHSSPGSELQSWRCLAVPLQSMLDTRY